MEPTDDTSFSPPLPVAPLEYQQPSYNRRPTIVIVIGILSIVLACISALAGASSMVSTASFLVMSRMTVPTVVPVTAPTTSIAGSTVTYSYSVSAGTSSYRSIAGPPPFPFRISRSILATMFITSTLGLLLAIFLFVAGIKMLRESPSSIRLHWIYIWVKIPMVLITAFSTWLWYTSFFTSMNTLTMGTPGMSPNYASIFAIGSVAVIAVFSLIYPIALMFMLSNRNLKAYLASHKP